MDEKESNKPPEHLSKDARVLWKRLVDEYGIVDSGGLAILRAGIEAFDRSQCARVLIDKHGLVIKDRFGAIKQNPLISCERDARAAFLQALKQLNLDLEPLKDIGRPPGR